MSAMNFGEKPRKRITINITSLVDILIVLLLFFMLTTQFIHMNALHLSVSTSVSDSESLNKNTDAIVIKLIGSNQFVIDGRKFDLLQLQEKIKPLLNKNKESDITLLSKKEVVVQEIVMAIDYIKAAGGKNISLAEDVSEYRK